MECRERDTVDNALNHKNRSNPTMKYAKGPEAPSSKENQNVASPTEKKQQWKRAGHENS